MNTALRGQAANLTPNPKDQIPDQRGGEKGNGGMDFKHISKMTSSHRKQKYNWIWYLIDLFKKKKKKERSKQEDEEIIETEKPHREEPAPPASGATSVIPNQWGQRPIQVCLPGRIPVNSIGMKTNPGGLRSSRDPWYLSPPTKALQSCSQDQRKWSLF